MVGQIIGAGVNIASGLIGRGKRKAEMRKAQERLGTLRGGGRPSYLWALHVQPNS